jgi:hypothetical protein
MAAFSMLPDFGFLTIAETERRRAPRERKVGKEQGILSVALSSAAAPRRDGSES